MSNHSPYNNELANKMENIPMPDINVAWADMEKRLTQKEDKKPVPFWLNGCAIFALLGLLIFCISFWFYTAKNKVQAKKDVATTILKDSSNTLNGNVNKILTAENNINTTEKAKTKNKNDVTQTNKEIVKDNFVTQENTDEIFEKNIKNYRYNARKKINITNGEQESDEVLNEKTKISSNKKSKNNTDAYANKYAKVKKVKGKFKTKIFAPDEMVAEASEETTPIIEKSEIVETAKEKVIPTTKDSGKSIIAEIIANTKKIIKEEKDTTPKKIITKPKSKSKFIFNTGIGLQQQIPIEGQTTTPYNSFGRKGTLLDYIPSVYARVEKNKKWFVQVEGKYGAPQYNKEFVYFQNNKPDTGFTSNFVNITTTSLKKSYYHQIPISFNYYVTPNWTLGAGIQWNKFTGAYTETELVRKNNTTQTQSTLNKFQSIEKLDSNNVFTKQSSVALLETQYQWKRFTLGAKYSFGLKPYISFTLPGGTEQNLTSKTALLFIKYELWSSKKRSKKKK